MTTYYNEWDPYCAQWLRNLISAGLLPAGDVDERSITDVQTGDLRGYRQCHFFAGIGGWQLALSLAGWPDDAEVWTGSCPCQPLSRAGQRKGHADERHLWPAFYRLVAECKPAMVFGEQVAGKDGLEWLSAVRADLEASGYAVGAADLSAASVGAPHRRQRLFWVSSLPNTNRSRWERERHKPRRTWDVQQFERLVQYQLQLSLPTGRLCLLVDGVSARTHKLRAYGNAIVPQVAVEFIQAAAEAISEDRLARDTAAPRNKRDVHT